MNDNRKSHMMILLPFLLACIVARLLLQMVPHHAMLAPRMVTSASLPALPLQFLFQSMDQMTQSFTEKNPQG